MPNNDHTVRPCVSNVLLFIKFVYNFYKFVYFLSHLSLPITECTGGGGGLNGVGDDRASSFELFKCARRPLAQYWVYPVSSIEAVCERGVYALNIWEISKDGELFLV